MLAQDCLGITIQSLLNFDIKAPNGLEVNSGSKVFERRAGGPAPALGRSDKRGETAWINDWPLQGLRCALTSNPHDRPPSIINSTLAIRAECYHWARIAPQCCIRHGTDFSLCLYFLWDISGSWQLAWPRTCACASWCPHAARCCTELLGATHHLGHDEAHANDK